MKFLGCLVFVAILGAITAIYSPQILDLLRGGSPNSSNGASQGKNWKDSSAESERDRNVEEFDRHAEDMNARTREMQIQRIEDQIERLEQSERDCYAASQRPGGTDGRCRNYTEQIRAAEDRLREYRSR